MVCRPVGGKSENRPVLFMSKEPFVSRSLSYSELMKFRDDGYLACGPMLTDWGLELIRKECVEIWQREKGPFDPAKTWLENSLFPNIHHQARTVRQFYFDGPLVDVVEQIIGPNVKAATSQLTFKMKDNAMIFPWHQDNGYGELDPYNAISCLTALDDTNRENGCLWVIPRSNQEGQKGHDLGKMAIDPKHGSELKTQANESKAIPITMKAGESMIMSCWTLHKSEANQSGKDRRILFFRYADADAVEVHNGRRPRLGRLLRGTTQYDEVREFESNL